MGDAHNCRVCGYYAEDPPWGGSGLEPSFDYCPCCHVEWGYQDSLPEAARQFRARWVAAGAPWDDEDFDHDGLTTEERLKNVPAGFE